MGDPPPSSSRRVNVVGTSGSGKSTLSPQLAERLGVPYVQLDALHWESNWVEATPEVFRARLAAAVESDGWVVDGNYRERSRELVWSRADTIVWLDLPLWLVMWQVIVRTARRIVTREQLFSGNRERLRMTLSRKSILWWALSTHGRRRREYDALFADPPRADLRLVRLRSRREVSRWLAAQGAE